MATRFTEDKSGPSIARQCELVEISRSSFYNDAKGESELISV
jgi:hypothetical protein